MPATPTLPASVSATRKVASLLSHLGVSAHAVDDTLGIINPLLTVSRLHARIEQKVQETPSACTLVLQAGAAFEGLVPGQFVVIGVTINGVRHRRAYSPRSVDGATQRIAITVQRQPGGRVSNHVHDHLKVGDIIEIEPAAGDFVLPERTPPEVLLIAGGSGITPCMSMLQHLERSNSSARITLLYFARSSQDRIFAQALQEMALRWPQLNYVPLDSSVNTSTGTPTGATLCEEVLDRAMPTWRSAMAWCCGPAPLMDTARRLWADGRTSGTLKLEAFGVARPSGDPNVRHQVSLQRHAEEIHFAAPTTETLLVAGEQAGYAIKHGCRQGICHECTCRLNQGAVKDLTTGDVIAGQGQTIRLCVSSALSDVQLESLN
ncbi:ferredoxin reductase [Aquabacterium lacunae]|uniref:Ferredoxin reductase n=1 Tax=Aquabacterium lacunae TaxID=2528630 RepID=A0A4Q9H2J9_9BURK|nr:ferredoxin reductase [Aquabacterium lacunae]TBO30138.1 ferredoxin reductase [Aquabacterium lacunae]